MNLHLITGGARSCKSRHALHLAEAAPKPLLIATAQAFDEEMAHRIARHQAERNPRMALVEEPLHLAAAICQAADQQDLVLVDCLTLWLSNLYLGPDEARRHEIQALLDLAAQPPVPLILVTNELGMGIVPENPLAREFRDAMGRLNQYLASRASHVTLVACGLPLHLKP